MPTPRKAVRFDAFIESVRPDPKSTEALVMLQGYIGKSDLQGHIRVYSDSTLSDFIELPDQDILYCDPVSTEEDPLGGSRLWVRKTTVFTTGDPAHANRIRSTFLEGDLIQAYGETVNAPGAVNKIAIPPTIPWFVCQTVTRPKSCCATQFGTPCTWSSPFQPTCRPTCNQPTCLQTCNQPTCLQTCNQPTCFKTCNQPSCFQTCQQPTCIRTCEQPSCFQTCFQPSCRPTCEGPNCTINTSGPIPCVITAHAANQRAAVNPTVTMACYEGGFNPYVTGY